MEAGGHAPWFERLPIQISSIHSPSPLVSGCCSLRQHFDSDVPASLNFASVRVKVQFVCPESDVVNCNFAIAVAFREGSGGGYLASL